MTKKRVKKSKAPVSGPVSKAAPAPSGIIADGPNGERFVMPHPDELLHEAEQEPDQADMAEYTTVIGTLRKKGFSFREIAEWLSDRGVPADHNAVYRIYTKNMDGFEQLEDALKH